MTTIPKTPNGDEGGSQPWFVVKRRWNELEDDKLRELVALHGPKMWNIISKQFQGRSGKSCRLRWINQLDPRINKTWFSAQEDAVLMAAHSVFGNQWSQIAKFLPGRTDNAIKNHWRGLTSRGERNTSIVYSSSSCGSFHHPGDNTITFMGKSASFSCRNTPNSRSVPTNRDGDTNVPSKARLTNTPFENTKSSTKTNHVTGSESIMSLPPPRFIDFLGVGDQ